jgi:hypothetical protein
VNTPDYAPPATDLDAFSKKAFAVGVVALAACAAGYFTTPDRFFRSWLTGWVWVLGIALGAHAVYLIHLLSRGAWGLVIRRVLEAAGRSIPVFALLFLPILPGLRVLYPWADASRVAHDEILHHQSAYLNVPFFLARLILYFVVWAGFAYALSSLSRKQDRAADPAAVERKMQMLAGPGLVLHILAVTFFAVDVFMSLNPHWFSTIYGLYLLGGQGVSGLAFVILIALLLSTRKPMDAVLQPRHVHDWGKLLLAFMMLWSYFAFSQFLIVWSGDLPEEIGFFKNRFAGGWGAVAVGLVLFHFAVPFLILLSRNLKRDVKKLSVVAALLLVMRWVDLWWLSAPAFSPELLTFHWLDVAAPLAMGGIFLGLFARQLRSRPLLPVHDPHLADAIAVPEGHHV